jgi:membrane fusion protein (multidrug efflux system)
VSDESKPEEAPAEAKPTQRNGGGSAWRIKAALGGLLVLGLLAAGYWYLFLRGTVYADDARVDGDLVDLAPELSGTLERVMVHEGDRVKRGELVFQLDRTALEAALAQAKAEVGTAHAALEVAAAARAKAKHGPRREEIRMAEQSRAKAEARAKLAAASWERAQKLYAEHAVPEVELERAQAEQDATAHALQELTDRVTLLRHGTRPEDREAAAAAVAVAQARIAAAEAAVRQAEIRLAHAEVRAPFDGVVVRRWRDPGAMLAPGTAVVTLMNPATLHVAANVEEKYLADLAVGDPVTISIDAFPGQELHGHVTQILRVTRSQFSLIPAEGVSGTFIKVTQRVPIRVAFDTPPALPLGPGLSVELRIRAHSTATAVAERRR